ncbi:hypothetical protein, conserved [Plasmodium gonderi]|uniref:Leucine-rich repeat protein n=1 Tax=Plasmodium gonderi TaxID=77519 RepID=A0A1Y1JGA2_PLAGO|nr:hypothetical protein, conserved [Plasmodium gonderi]GAW80365.1 hypothetical protein, conserved [Plasmodium gonderi]
MEKSCSENGDDVEMVHTNDNCRDEKKEHKKDFLFDDIIPESDYRRIGTNVINEKMLMENIDNKNKVRRTNLIDEFNHVKVLSLENKNILIIQNIDLFKSLEELNLDNNLIEDIENLDGLINLKILSMSNNKIKEIKNLNKLTNLLELNLHNNRIERIENLNNNVKLKILILSKNKISEMQNITYLKIFKNLKFLSLIDNPICQNKNIINHVGSNLINLKYFNNLLLVEEIRYAERSSFSPVSKKQSDEDKDDMDYFTLKNNANSNDNYEKKIEEAYLLNITTLDQSLFNKKKDPSVFLKIDFYSKIKDVFLQDIHQMSSVLIDQILQLNEERNKCSDTFENDVENFTSQYMQSNVAAFNKLRKRSKRVVRSLLSFLGCEEGLHPVELKKCPDFYKKRTALNDNKTLNDAIAKRIQNTFGDFHFKQDSDQVGTYELSSCDIYAKESDVHNTFIVEEAKYKIIKKYIEKNMEENFLFRDKLINEELANMVSINSFIENFQRDVSKIIKSINDKISNYFRKLDELEENFNSKIINFFAEVKNNEHPLVTLSEDEINEYYTYKGNRSNILNNLEDFISSSYNKSGSFLIEEKKKHLFIKSRNRISEIEKIVDMFNDLFYSYLCVLRVQ